MTEQQIEQSRSRLYNVDDQTVVTAVGIDPSAQFLKSGDVLDGKFEIIEILGEGGMGCVYKAHHLLLNKDVAIKTFRSANLDSESVARFQREAQVIGRLSHPNIVQVYDFGFTAENYPYYSMECLHGFSLADYLEEKGKLSLLEAADIFEQVSIALAASHSKGVVHRDMKPANIFLVADERRKESFFQVKIVDFGIAALTGRDRETQKLTRAGVIFGSPLYMSPEQTVGRATTGATDIYSCGCALFETLTGQVPFHGDSAFATMMMHQNEPTPDIGDYLSRQPQRLRSLLLAMMAKNPEERPSFEEVAGDLRSLKLTVLDAASPYSISRIANRSASDEGSQFQKKRTTGPAPIMRVSELIAVLIGIGAAASFLLNGKKADSVQKQEALPGPAQANASASLRKTTALPEHYLVHYDDNGMIFDFPRDVSLGQLRWFAPGLSRDQSDNLFEVKGHVVGPRKSYAISLVAGEAIYKNPQLLRPFGPGDLGELIFDEPYSWTPEHLAAAVHLSKLRELRLARTREIGDECISDLNKFAELDCLSIAFTKISAEGLLKLKRLPDLNSLDIQGMKNASRVISVLERGTKLTLGDFSHTDITDEDIRRLSGMGSLNQLTINDCRKLTDKSMEYLSRKKNWQSLRLRSCAVSCSALLRVLGSCSQLKELTIAVHQFKPVEIYTIKQECDRRGVTLHLKEDELSGHSQDVEDFGTIYSSPQ